MKNGISRTSTIFCAVVLLIVILAGPSMAQGKGAAQQLNSFGNTGTVFDGPSKTGQGIDTTVNKPTGNIPNASPPAAVNTSTGTAGGYSVGTSTGTSQGTTTGGNATSGKSGSEKAH
jgi:hypothetical protein